MNRRNFITSLAVGAATLAFFTKTAEAQTAPPKPGAPVPPKPIPVKVSLDISNNHGHTGLISYESVIVGNKLSISIQGSAGHPHTIILTEEDLAVLRRKLVVDVKSSVDANHSHMVRITRVPVPN